MNPRRHITFANVCSVLALFVALSTGGAYAATLLTGKNIKDGSLTGKDLAASSVDSTKVKNGSVGGLDLATDSVDGTKLSHGAVHQDDLAAGSVDGAAVADNSIALTDLTPATRSALSVQVVKQSVNMVPTDPNSAGEPKQVDIACPDGTRAIGGGSYSDYWIAWGESHSSTAAGNIGAKPTGRPILDGTDQATGWHLQVGSFPRDYGVWMLTEVGPEPTPPFAADQFDPITAYALCAA